MNVTSPRHAAASVCDTRAAGAYAGGGIFTQLYLPPTSARDLATSAQDLAQLHRDLSRRYLGFAAAPNADAESPDRLNFVLFLGALFCSYLAGFGICWS